MFKLRLFFITAVFLIGCTPEHPSPTSNIFENNIPKMGVLLEVSEDGQLINIPQVESSLNDNQKKIFNLSMQWIATESEIKFIELKGKSAYLIIQIANCLKINENKGVDCIKST
ncbi:MULTISPECIES: hypothetical protein [unclassified Moritella]|uniref:hypothetical protein n=1 Tax=unclassified Moritella TaxID=2637987 RepID=UPI001BADE9D1|nr:MULTISPECIES: hypothetical protein [unclassified Moritella]QUM85647.1 hypothetical protein HWV02_14580 [Moritella sp. 28]QUM89865.1 hypothetical protein HWV03_14150 [Moritella sp. 36]